MIPLTDLWVTANFKETQLEQYAAGQPVTIEGRCAMADASFPARSRRLAARRDPAVAVPAGERDRNYVKVVQRIPVRIDFTNLAAGGRGLRSAAWTVGDARGCNQGRLFAADERRAGEVICRGLLERVP